MKPPDFEKRLHFCRWFRSFLDTKGIRKLDKVFGSVQVPFAWVSELLKQPTLVHHKSTIMHKRPLHDEKLRVWCCAVELGERSMLLIARPDQKATKAEISSSYYSSDPNATRELLVTDHVILNHGQVTWTTPELAPPLLTTSPHQREDVSALDRFNVHRCPTRRALSGTRLELKSRTATIGYLDHSATVTTRAELESFAKQLLRESKVIHLRK
ncbi:uncharacterized protein TNCV_424591 [Trichonephila clavipes]|nr:uncharacterized protein TNCV_424591 [Trichonephila clavipes]